MAQKGVVQGTYDVEHRVGELIPTSIKISGHTFDVKRSGKVLRQIIAMAPDEEYEKNDDDSYKLDAEGERILTNDDPEENIRLLYESLAILFRDQETGRTPKVDTLLPPQSERDEGEEYPETFAEWLEEELDIDVAQELMGKLVPRRAEGNPTGSGSVPAP